MTGPSTGSLIVNLGSFTLALMLVFATIRFYTKWHIARKATADDLTCLLAVFGAIVNYTANILMVSDGFGIFGQSSPEILAHRNFYTIFYVSVVNVPITLLFTKMCFYILYLQIFKPIVLLRRLIYLGAIMTTGYYVACAVAQFVIIGKISSFNGSYAKVIKLARLGVASSIMGVVSDFYILLLPISGVLKLQIARRRKIEIIVIFSTGLLTSILSALNLYYRILSLRNTNSIPIVLLSLTEIHIGIICACMPAFSRMLHHHLPKYGSVKAYLSFMSLKNRRTASTHGTYNTATGPYSNLDMQLEMEDTIAFGASTKTSGLGETTGIRTQIAGKSSTTGIKEYDDDGIHLEQVIQQTWSESSIPQNAHLALKDNSFL